MPCFHRAVLCSYLWIHLVVAGCGSPGAEPAPDAPRSTVPVSAAGELAVTSAVSLQVPPEAAPIVGMLAAATDGPDDPARFLVDCMVATLPDGPVKSVATRAAPLVAAYLNATLDDIAPHFVAGVDAIGAGLSRIATQLGTIETWRIAADGSAVRTITAARFELGAPPAGVGATPVTVSLAESGLPNIAVEVRVSLDSAGRVAIGEHGVAMPYGALLRLGLDRAVVPSVVPMARDLATALDALVDCDRLGAAIADQIGIGSSSLYRAACRAGMTAIASEIDDHIAAIDERAFRIDLSGAAQGVDVDGDGSLDELRSGAWAGSLSVDSARQPITASRFTGTRIR